MNKRPLGCLFEVVETLVLTVVIFLVIQNFVAQPYKVEQESMEATLHEGQYLLVDKLTPHFDEYSRGDIVVFTPPEGSADSVPFIKRVIGIPGDHIDIADGHVAVNGIELDERDYVFQDQPTEVTGDRSSFDVPDDRLFVLGDHRSNSTDSRAFGPIGRDHIIGRAWLRYWPLDTLAILQVPRYPNLNPSGVGTP